MSNHQDMSRKQGRTQAAADNRLAQLKAHGHQLEMEAGPDRATISITRSDGAAHHVTMTPELLPENTRNGTKFKQHPQSVLIAYALHAIADWSNARDKLCLNCNQPGAAPNYNQLTGKHDWFCPTCFYGTDNEATA
jgi:hypothetical protein